MLTLAAAAAAGFVTRLVTDVVWHATVLEGGVKPLVLGRDVAVRPSRGRGLGIFALRPIPANTFIERYDGEMGRVADQKAAGSSGKYNFGLEYNFDDPELSWAVDAEKPSRSGYARYINHSVGRRNCRSVYTDLPRWLIPTPLPSPYAVWIESKRDIAAGEELFYDYGQPYWDELTPLSRPLQARLPKDSLLFALNARLNPRRVVIDWF